MRKRLSKPTAFAMLLLPLCASAEAPWQPTVQFGSRYELAQCVNVKVMRRNPDGTEHALEPSEPYRSNWREPWNGKWKHCRVRHVKTKCTGLLISTPVVQQHWSGLHDEWIDYRVGLDDWVCPSGVTPPPKDDRHFFREFRKTVVNRGTEAPAQLAVTIAPLSGERP